MTASTIISSEFTNISSQLSGSAWTVSEESVGGVSTAVLVRHSERLLRGQKSGDFDKEKFFLVKTDPSFACNTNGNSFRPSSPMGGQEWPGRDGQAVAASVSPSDGTAVGGVCDGHASSGVAVEDGAVASPEVVFGGLPTVKAMGTGKRAPVIGFDTEFTYRKDGSRVIDSYQFSLIDPSDSDYRFDIVLLPLIEGERLPFESALCVVIRESGLWRAAGLPDARGFDRRDFWESGCDYGANLNALYKLGRFSLVLAGHYLNADLTAFARPHGNSKYADILRRVTSASGGLVSLQPVRVIERSGAYGSSERWLPLSVTIRDTMGQSAPGMQSLAVLGDSVGIPKINVPGDWKMRMSEYREQHLIDFLEYSANDAVIVLEYLSAVWGEGVVPPVTLSGGGAHALRDGVKRYWGLEGMPNSLFMARFQGLMKLNEGKNLLRTPSRTTLCVLLDLWMRTPSSLTPCAKRLFMEVGILPSRSVIAPHPHTTTTFSLLIRLQWPLWSTLTTRVVWLRRSSRTVNSHSMIFLWGTPLPSWPLSRGSFPRGLSRAFPSKLNSR